MKLKSILVAIIALSVFNSCGSKKEAATLEDAVRVTNAYALKVDQMDLKTEVTEGALTDAEGFKDIGTFKYTVYYDEKTKELFKINNIEKTSETINETYYFKDGKYAFVKFADTNLEDSQLPHGSSKDGPSKIRDFYKDKGERFQKAFKRNH